MEGQKKTLNVVKTKTGENGKGEKTERTENLDRISIYSVHIYTYLYIFVTECICTLCLCCTLYVTLIIMYIYHALINALSAHMIHINLNMIFYTHVKHSPTKTIYIKYYLKNK